MKVKDGNKGKELMMKKNLFVMKRYKNEDKYEMEVGMIEESIGGYKGLRKEWKSKLKKIQMNERMEMKKKIKEIGYYEGKIEGKIGEK